MRLMNNARVDVVIDASSGRDNLPSASIHQSIHRLSLTQTTQLPFIAFITRLLCATRILLLSADALVYLLMYCSVSLNSFAQFRSSYLVVYDTSVTQIRA